LSDVNRAGKIIHIQELGDLIGAQLVAWAPEFADGYGKIRWLKMPTAP
jgi:hypothetical protein